MKKNLKRIGIGFLIIILILLIGVLFSPVSPHQTLVWEKGTVVTTFFDEDYLQTKFDSLNALYGNKKELPKGYELQALLALSAYPELKDVRVRFEFSKSVNAPLEANFSIPTLFLPWRERVYRVIISSAEEGFLSQANFKNINFNGQIGILAHELGHVKYYDECNLFQIGNWGLGYLMKKDFANIHERETDKIVIYRGLGWQLLESTLFFNQYFGSQEKLERSELVEALLKTEGPFPIQNQGRYLSIDGVLHEMINRNEYEQTFVSDSMVVE